MHLDILFPHFHDLIRTPEDVQRLNEAILQLAVQGKLVPQDPDDEPASELLKRIEAEKRQLEKEGKIQSKQASASIRNTDTPFQLPSGWKWVHVGEVMTLWNGRAFARPELLDAGTPIIRIQNLNGGNQWYYSNLQLADEKYCNHGDLLYAWSGTFGPYIWQGEKSIYHYHIWRVDSHAGVSKEYVYYLLKAITASVKSDAHGIMLLHMTKGGMEDIMIALPPLAEQKRIVAKVESLFAQTRTLEAKLRRAQADIVVVNKAALHRLQSAGDNGQRGAAWATVAEHFDLLYSDARNVAELRQTILQLAVQGKLVPQDPDDEPASELLTRIGQERYDDIGKIKSLELLSGISDNEIPCELPGSWVWTRFLGVANIATNSTDPALFPDLPHIAPDNIEKFTGKLLTYQTVAEDGVSSVNHHFFPGQILYSKIRPNLSKAILVDFEGLCSADMYPIQPLIDPRYLHLYILSSIFLAVATRTDTRVAMPKINQEALNKIPVAVPPLAEQKRIVAKVDQLMAMCDALEAKLGQAEVEGRVLAQAVLAKATSL